MAKASGVGCGKPMGGKSTPNASSLFLFPRRGHRQLDALLGNQQIVRLGGGWQVQLITNQSLISEREPEHRLLVFEDGDGLLLQVFFVPQPEWRVLLTPNRRIHWRTGLVTRADLIQFHADFQISKR